MRLREDASGNCGPAPPEEPLHRVFKVPGILAEAVALFPVAEQVAVLEAGPAGAAFEERYVEAGEAARHATRPASDQGLLSFSGSSNVSAYGT